MMGGPPSHTVEGMTISVSRSLGTRLDGKLRAMARTPLFEGCSRSELALMGRLFDTSDLAAGTTFAAEPLVDRWVSVVLSGVAIVSCDGRVGHVVRAGDTLSRLQVVSRCAGPHRVTALTPVGLLSLDRRRFGALACQAPSVANALRHSSPWWDDHAAPSYLAPDEQAAGVLAGVR
jgi:hypothetical protein